MDETKLSQARKEILQKIKEYEQAGRFDEDVENDPPAPVLMPDKVDYLCKKLSSKIKMRTANFIGDRYFLGLIKKDILVIDGVEGVEKLCALQNGAVVICNHFSPFDNYIVFHCIRKYMPKKWLYKIIREGNYTNFPGLYGFLFRNCNTLPLSSNRRTMMNMLSACDTLLKRGETILIYPEQAMWWNYKKPRPFKIGGFKIAYKSKVPVIPTLITMQDDESRLDGDGYPVQRHTLHIMPAVYPDLSLSEKEGAQKMMEECFNAVKNKYEEVYQTPLSYGNEE
ncbi:MAG: 1-acyl-sn-glycerol-3-phosphate acyltransferase, partial [Clostridia bacterium]|nr:1-acyl-sn-glycerol-3-phosphate acyltransferase [Clostridia bacterium]